MAAITKPTEQIFIQGRKSAISKARSVARTMPANQIRLPFSITAQISTTEIGMRMAGRKLFEQRARQYKAARKAANPWADVNDVNRARSSQIPGSKTQHRTPNKRLPTAIGTTSRGVR